MGLFNWSGKKPEVKLAELKDRVDTIYPTKVMILQEGEQLPSSAQIISKDYDHLTYIDTDNATYYIQPTEIEATRDANGTLHRHYSPNREYSTTIDVADINTTALYDAIGTPCHGTFNKEYKPVLQVETPATFVENELEKRLKELESKLAKTVSLVHNCANCGATLEVEENKPVIHCKYCGSAYIVGTARIYSNY